MCRRRMRSLDEMSVVGYDHTGEVALDSPVDGRYTASTSHLGQHQAQVQSLPATVQGTQDVEIMKADVQTMQTDVQTIQADVQPMNVDVQTMKADVQIIEADVQPMNVDVQTMKADVQIIEADVQIVETDVQAMKVDSKNNLPACVLTVTSDVQAKEMDHESIKTGVQSMEAVDKIMAASNSLEFIHVKYKDEILHKEYNMRTDQDEGKTTCPDIVING